MSGVLFPAQKAAELAGFKIQTAVYGLPLPVVYGTARIPGNLVHMPTPPTLQSQTQGKISGITAKGSQTQNEQTYYSAMIIALCEGEIEGIGNVWRDKDSPVDFNTVMSAKGFGLAVGDSSQTPWATLPSTQQLGYREVAYVDHPAWPLPNNSLSSYSWEVRGFLKFSVLDDASPADIIPDYLTSAQYGAGFPSAQIGSLTQFQDYCAAFSIFVSPAFTSQQSARDQLNELLEIANTGAVWSDGVLKFKPYGDVAKTANGHTYTPNTTPLYDLTNNDYLSRGEGVDPIIVKRKSPVECFNQVTVEYEDRSFDYNRAQQKAEEQASLLANGPRPMPPMQLRAIKTEAVAQQVGQIRLQREQNVRNTYAFKLGWRFILLEPMDLVTLTDTGLGLSRTPVRITQIVELEDEQGIEVTAEDWPFGTASATLYRTASNTGTSADTNANPGDTFAPIIFDGPPEAITGPYELWVAASGGASWGGCEVWLSTDNSNFTKVGTIIGKCTYGELTGSMAIGARYPSVDVSATIAVDVSDSLGSLSAMSQDQFDTLAFPVWVNGEYMAYRDLALTSAYHYDLTHLYRGVFMSSISTHAATNPFVLINDRIARIPFPTAKIGQTLYVKLPSFNVYGGGVQDVSTVSSYSHVLTASALPRLAGMPQGTVSIDSNGSWSATADGPSTTNSYKYLTSTSAYPSDASVIAGGTVVTGRSFSVTAGGTLTFGQTIYITIVPYSYQGGNGVAMPSIHLRGSYQTYSGSKTTSYAPTFWTLEPSGTGSTARDFTITSGTLQCVALTAPVVNGWSTSVVAHPVVPDGVVISEFSLDVYNNAGGATPGGWFVNRVEGNTETFLGSDAASAGGGWQTLTVAVSEDTTGRVYSMLYGMEGPANAGDLQIAQLYITYSYPDPTKTI